MNRLDAPIQESSGAELQCLKVFAVAGVAKFGIRNNCKECKIAVVSWMPTVGIRRYRVRGNSEVVISIEDQEGQLIGENPC